jgi:hypothetical protein
MKVPSAEASAIEDQYRALDNYHKALQGTDSEEIKAKLREWMERSRHRNELNASLIAERLN